MSLHYAPFVPAVVAALAVAVFAPAAQPPDAVLNLKLRNRPNPSGFSAGPANQYGRQWNPKQTAIIVCDMWDQHWCKSAEARVGELVGPVEATLKAAREKGVFVIHAPSTCTDFYKDTPQRKRAKDAPFAATPKPLAATERWGTAWNWPDSKREGVLPIDDSDMGCDCKTKCTIREAWTRQHAAITIALQDAVTDNGQETWNLLAERGISNVMICGVHLNMCVLGRPFAIRALASQGKTVALIRDLTDTMYNPERPPGVSHFEGTDRVVTHVEQYWCPTFLSSDITGTRPFQFKDDTRGR